MRIDINLMPKSTSIFERVLAENEALTFRLISAKSKDEVRRLYWEHVDILYRL